MTLADIPEGRHNLHRLAVLIADDLRIAFEPDNGPVSQLYAILARHTGIRLFAREQGLRYAERERPVFGDDEVNGAHAHCLVGSHDDRRRGRRIIDHTIQAELQNNIGRMLGKKPVLLFLL